MTCGLLQELRAIGVEVTPQGDNLAIRPASKVPPELKERLRAHKAEVLAVLKAEAGPAGAHPATCAASCYEIEPGRWLHHSWDGCKTIPVSQPGPTVERTCWHCGGKGKWQCIAL
jgi:hypothetical protein